ncbi:hypothetical protein H5410_055136 [Solanum commersonii]|uniref:Uncharacterized protein n=1 Tax=Solanum commersonii TaxID=4109 RepID=A0A9J5WHD7_SOLCO|nr:hypothetical protein H5410_055136 [Solanum commersonii]
MDKEMQFVESFEVSFRDYLQLEIGLLIVYEPIYLTLVRYVSRLIMIGGLELVYSDLDTTDSAKSDASTLDWPLFVNINMFGKQHKLCLQERMLPLLYYTLNPPFIFSTLHASLCLLY